MEERKEGWEAMPGTEGQACAVSACRREVLHRRKAYLVLSQIALLQVV